MCGFENDCLWSSFNFHHTRIFPCIWVLNIVDCKWMWNKDVWMISCWSWEIWRYVEFLQHLSFCDVFGGSIFVLSLPYWNIRNRPVVFFVPVYVDHGNVRFLESGAIYAGKCVCCANQIMDGGWGDHCSCLMGVIGFHALYPDAQSWSNCKFICIIWSLFRVWQNT